MTFQAVFRIPHPTVPYAYNEVHVIGDTFDVFYRGLKEVSGASEAVYLAQETLHFGYVGGEPVGTEMVAPSNAHGQAVPQPAPQRTQPAQPQPPSCAHGPRTYVTGKSAKGPWAAWFCALPKGSPGGCAPEWVGV